MSSTCNKKSYDRASSFFPGGVNSPVRSGCAVGMRIPIMQGGEGAYLKDINGRSYLDCCLAWGALIHGHAHPKVHETVSHALRDGAALGLTTMKEVLLAEKIQQSMPSIEMMRFVSTGTEATMSALRLARAYTNRPYLITFSGHYHGHSDAFLVQRDLSVQSSVTARSRGIPREAISHTIVLPFHDFEAVDHAFDMFGPSIAAIILEPIAANMGVIVPDQNFLSYLRQKTEKNGSLLIFDEIVTGFRVGRHGAQGLYHIAPDITCLGKIIGGGFPGALFGGRKVIMEQLAPIGDVYQAGTFSAHPITMEAGLATLSLLEDPNFYTELQKKMDLLTLPIIEYIHRCALPISLQSSGSMFSLTFYQENGLEAQLYDKDYQKFQKLFHFMISRNILIPPSQDETWFLSSAHRCMRG